MPLPLLVTLQRYNHCRFCGHTEVIIWQGDCGCFVAKCLLCGTVGWVDCGDENEDHWNQFEIMADAVT